MTNSKPPKQSNINKVIEEIDYLEILKHESKDISFELWEKQCELVEAVNNLKGKL